MERRAEGLCGMLGHRQRRQPPHHTGLPTRLPYGATDQTTGSVCCEAPRADALQRARWRGRGSPGRVE